MLKWLVVPLLMTSVALADADPEALNKITKGLKANKLEPMLAALDQAGKLGRDALPVAGEVARQIANPNKKISTAALEAYEKIEPKIHPLLVAVIVEKNDTKRVNAIRSLKEMGKDAKSALPLLSLHFAQESKDPDGDWGPLLEALVRIDGTDNYVVNQVLAFTQVQPLKDSNSKQGAAREVARGYGIRAMSSITVASEKKVKALTAALSYSTDSRRRIEAIRELEAIGAPAKNAIPQLKALKTSGDSQLRQAASQAVTTIESR